MKDLILVAELEMVKKSYLSFYFKGGYSGKAVSSVIVRYNEIKGFQLICGEAYILHLRYELIRDTSLVCQLLKIRKL